MKKAGLIGGMSWESTLTYYQIMNETVKEKLGGLHSAELLLYSVDFDEIEKCQAAGDWDKSTKILSDAACALERAGADFIVICTNTMHKTADDIQKTIQIPILHIAEATAEELLEKKITTTALLGTRYTMTQDFYKQKLINAGIKVLVPDEADIEIINNIIYKELCLGIITEKAKEQYLQIIAKLEKKGAEAVILGCTEIGLLIQQDDLFLPVFDTAQIHARRAAYMALEIIQVGE